jgi:hypothetical protein
VKLGLRGGQATLLAEIPLEPDVDPRPLVQATLADLGQATTLWSAGEAEAAPEPAQETPAAGRQAPDLASLATAAGWPFTEREGGVLAVPLEVPGRFQQALIECERDVRTELRAELLGLGNLRPAARQAMAHLLLTAAAEFRLVRGLHRPHGRAVKLGFAVAIAALPSAFWFDHALQALSLACRFCSGELTALADESLAREYLVLTGSPVQERG